MREERGWSQQRAFEQLHEALGLGPRSRASYISLEKSREPDPDQQEAIAEFYKARPNELDQIEPEPETGPLTLAGALYDLTVELREMRHEREAWQQGLRAVMLGDGGDQALSALLAALAPEPHEAARR